MCSGGLDFPVSRAVANRKMCEPRPVFWSGKWLCAIGEKQGGVVFSGALSLVLSLDEQRKNIKITTPAEGTETLTHYVGNIIYEG